MPTQNKIPLYGFNNLTKSLSFSLYRVHYLPTKQALDSYHTYINDMYSSQQLETLLTKICHAIGGNVLNVANQDYTPQGASVTLMISEEAKPESLVAHLDKSHLCIHTYPEETPKEGMAIFRADIELSTCGVISPLKVLDYVIEAFSADVIDIDYRIRGMTRDKQGNKYFSDHNIVKISQHLSKATLANYQIKNSVMAGNNLYHCKLTRSDINLQRHLFNATSTDTPVDETQIELRIRRELSDLFAANNPL